MTPDERETQLESLKTRFRDGNLSREELLLEASRIGGSTAVYAWLNELTTDLASTAESTPTTALPSGLSELQQLAERVEIVNFRPKPEQYGWTFGGLPPVLHVKPGQVLRLWTEDAFAGNIKSKRDLPSKVLKYPFVNPQTGPFYVEGADVGDTLAIHLIDMQPAADHAVSTTIPLFGSLSGTQYTQLLHPALPEIVWLYKVDLRHRTVRYEAHDSDYAVDIPLEPFLGTIGVAPKAYEARNVLVPEAFGGNMDSPEARAGTTLYLGVNVPGALFSLGDGHYAQSEGEVCGVAVEGRMNVALVVDVIKHRYVDWPRLENDDFIMTAGSYRPLEDAFRIAFTQMVQWIAADFGLSLMDAYQLVSQVAKTQVANVVDVNYTILARMPKRYLRPGITVMGDTHRRLRAYAQAVGDRARIAD